MSYKGPDDNEVRVELDRILRQPEFQSSPRLSSFLRFVVEETLDGRASRLKAFTIATSVFGRDEGFDPQTNPIVRVEALRLRRMLDQYYVAAGVDDDVEIRIRRGSYVPEFTHRHRAAPGTAVADLPAAADVPLPALATPARPRVWLPGVLALLLLMVGAVAWLRPLGSGDPVQPPRGMAPSPTAQATIRVGPFRFGSTPELMALADILETRIEDTISRFDNPLVIHDPERVPISDYQITASLALEADGTAEIGFRMLHVASREIIWTRQVSGIPIDPAKARVEGAINGVAASIAQTYGAVFSDMRKRLPKNTAELSGYSCVIQAYGALNNPVNGSLEEGQACLDRAIAADPSFASAHAALAQIWTAYYLMGTSPDPSVAVMDHASELANRAVSLAPQKSRPHTAQFTTRFFTGRIEDAFESARVAMELNPYAAETLGRVGAAHILRGEMAQGRDLISRAVKSMSVPPGWLEFYLWLDAWQQGDSARAHRHAARRGNLQFPLGMLARIITASETGEPDVAKHWSERLRSTYPVFASNIPASLSRYGMVSGLQDRMLAALDNAGLPRTGPPAH